MTTYIIRRLLYFIPMLFLVSILAFVIIQAPPGDVLTSQIEQLRMQYGSAAEDRIEMLRDRYGLDQPMHVRYFKWIGGIITRGDFGRSFTKNRPVSEIIAERLPATIALTLGSLLFTWMVAIPIALYSAVKQYSVFDYDFTFMAFVGRSIPNFFLALVLMFIFFEAFGWSLGGLFSVDYKGEPWSIAKFGDFLKHLILPIIVIGTAGTAGMVRVLRGMMLDELNKDYIETARAKGLSEGVIIWKHALKVAIRPMIATIGWLLPRLVSGAMITAIVLNLPTTGPAVYSGLMSQDMYLVGSFILLVSTLTLVGTLVSDIALAWIDPRIRYD